MQDRFLTVSEFMSLCGAWMGTETAIQLWSIFGKYALNLQHIHCIITLKRFGGVVIGGTPKKYGTKEIFPAIIPLLFGSGISPAWGSYLPMPRHWKPLSFRRCRNLVGWLCCTSAVSYGVTTAYFGYPKHCADGFLYSFSSRRIDCFSLSFLLSQIETAYFLPAKWHYADSE